ncbi:hypothetical protein Trydic_g12367 [Trypoxylus dichotomus]
MSKFILLVSFLAGCTTALPTKSSAEQKTNRAGNFRISGGNDAADGAYPFMVSLRKPPNVHFCGGTIISTSWILTAGHCVLGLNTSNVVAVVGTNTLNTPALAKRIHKIVVHPKFNNTGYHSHDIGMILVYTPFVFSSNIAPVAIKSGILRLNTNVVVIGWGQTEKDGPLSMKLQELSARTSSRSFCWRFYRGTTSPTNICTRYATRKGFCHGDSGGPLLQADIKAQLGIASFNNEYHCGTERMVVDVYIWVAPYLGWIQETIHSTKLTS